MSVSFDEPVTYEQLEAAGAYYLATFRLAKAFDIDDAYKLVQDLKSQAEYQVGVLREAKAEVIAIGEASNSNDPINLDDIPF